MVEKEMMKVSQMHPWFRLAVYSGEDGLYGCGMQQIGEKEGVYFGSLTEGLMCAEMRMNQTERPRPEGSLREFAGSRSRWGTYSGKDSSAIPSGRKQIAVFQVQVLARQHNSWQGVIFWKQQRQSFRSVLELLHLIYSALPETENEKAARSGISCNDFAAS